MEATMPLERRKLNIAYQYGRVIYGRTLIKFKFKLRLGYL